MIHSFRAQLTFWYVAFFSLLFFVFSLFLYGVMAKTLGRQLDERLSSEAATTAGQFEDELVEEHGDIGKAASEAVSGMRLHGTVAAVLDGSNLLAASSPLTAQEAQAIAAQAAENPSEEIILALPHLGQHGSRAAVRKIHNPGGTFVALSVAPLDPIVRDLRDIRRMLFFAAPLLIALAAVGGYLVATRSLAPVGWMARQAKKITGENLETRLEIGNAAEELRVLADSFNELLSRLDQAFESMRRFVADASHELRTPIAVIRGEADVALSQDRAPAEYRESLAIVLDEARRISRLVDDLLNLARADAGRVRLHATEFYFNDLLAECCRSAQALAGARRIDLACSPGGEDVPFRGDEELLRRLVMNLLDNAIRYTPHGGKVSAALETGEASLRIVIADTGPGIAPEIAPHIFERFYRGDKSRSREGGFGLGLAIVKWIAEAHHGTVDLDSVSGEGTKFTVTLPR